MDLSYLIPPSGEDHKKTSTLWNTIECCRGFKDMKDEISSSLEASDILGLIFY